MDCCIRKTELKGNITKTKVYFPSGKIMEKGQSKLVVTDDFRHWFYFGDWKYYDENGVLKYIKKYQLNKMVDSISYIK